MERTQSLGQRSPSHQLFLTLARPDLRDRVERALGAPGPVPAWASRQQAFLEMVDQYVLQELAKPVESNIHQHEAGGHWRIAFPHLAVRGDPHLAAGLRDTMLARRAWTDAHTYHGYHDCHEVHHQIETFIYFQLPLFYWRLPGADIALASIQDVAHHMGNWEPGVPAWYDWERRGFRSVWLGTREVRPYPPFDYQEANHFRFIDVAMAAYLGTGQERYLELIRNYADRWCEHIEARAGAGRPIRCAIFPPGVEAGEMGRAGKDGNTEYKGFYSAVSDNTTYDIAGALLDLYRVCGDGRYLQATRLLMDQFFAHGAGGRPARAFREGRWLVVSDRDDLTAINTYVTDCTFLARLAVRHDTLTGSDRYREPVLAWARAIDESVHLCDQMMANVLVAAHHYDGAPAWLERAYGMALRTAAVVEPEDEYHQCNWARTRQGTKFLMELLYLPLLGGGEWGTRGNILLRRLQHSSGDGTPGLPAGVAFRSWRVDGETDAFEAVHTGQRPIAWEIRSAGEDPLRVERTGPEVGSDGAIRLAPQQKVAGRICWQRNPSAVPVRPLRP